MRKKIVGILVCMLMIATAVPAVTSIKNNAIGATVPTISESSMTGDWIETQKLLASDGAANKRFGTSVSFDGDTAVVGSVLGDGITANSGSAYVFTRTGDTWTQQQKLFASDGATNDQFGCFVSLSGDTALIGSCWDDDNGVDSGSVYIFTRTGTTWTQQQKLTAPDGTAGDWFAYCVSLVGDTALIGAQGDPTIGDFGAAYAFTRTGTTWTLQQELFASDGAAGDCFGYTVSLDGDTALIGADYDDDNGADSGSAYVFTRTGTVWTQQAKLLASDGAAGDDFSGGGVVLYGDTALIGAEMDDDNGTDSGSAYVFTRTGTTWIQQAKLLASDGAAGDQFSAYGLSLYGDTAFIGAWNDDDMGSNSGSVYIFTRTGTTWTQQQKILPSDGAVGDQFGVTISLVDDTAFIGSWADDDAGVNSGSVYVFTKTNIPPVEVPIWEVGDSWTYNYHELSYKYYTDGTVWYQSYHNCTWTETVIDDTGDTYILKVTAADNEWGVTIGKFVLKFTPFTKFSGEFVYRKTDLAMLRRTDQVKGFAFWMIGNILPFPAQYSSLWEVNHTNGYRFLPFPLNDGTNGTNPAGSQTIRQKASLYWGLISLFDYPAQSYPYDALDYYCEMENITVLAGDFEAYNVSIDLTFGLGVYHHWAYYVPEVGNQAKMFHKSDVDTSGKPGDIIEQELVSFNYTP